MGIADAAQDVSTTPIKKLPKLDFAAPTPIKKLPKLDFAKLKSDAAAGDETKKDTGRVEDFDNFWDEAEEPEAPGTVRIGTPRKLEIFKIDGDEASQAGAAKAAATVERAALAESFSPPWPFWAQGRVPTTLEVMGLPRGLDTATLVAQLSAWGLACSADFVHCPPDLVGCDGQGYAVLNAPSHADACALAGCLNGFLDWVLPWQQDAWAMPHGLHASAGHWSARGQQSARGDVSARVGGAPGRAMSTVQWSLSLQGMEQLMMHYQMHPDGSSVGPWYRFGAEWTAMPAAVHVYTTPSAIQQMYATPRSARGATPRVYSQI